MPSGTHLSPSAVGMEVGTGSGLRYEVCRQVVHFDLPPFNLLNLAFSLQAPYAAHLILLAQTRQADREEVRTRSRRQAPSPGQGHLNPDGVCDAPRAFGYCSAEPPSPAPLPNRRCRVHLPPGAV